MRRIECQAEERQRVMTEILEVLGEAAAAIVERKRFSEALVPLWK